MMTRLNNHSKKACPNCGCFCFADTDKPIISALRVPASIAVAATVALYAFFSRDMSAHPLTFGFIWGAITFWTSMCLIGWPLQWLLLLILKTTKKLVGDTGLPGPVQQQLYLHGFSTTVEPGKLTVIAERVVALDRITKWIWFSAICAIVGVILPIPTLAISRAGSLYLAFGVYGFALFCLVLNASYFYAKDKINLATIAFDSNGLEIQETGPFTWPRSRLSLMRNQITQFFVDTTKAAMHTDHQSGYRYVGDLITHSLSVVTDNGHRVPLIRTENQALGELHTLEQQIEHFWTIKDVQLEEFAIGVTTYVA